MIKSRRRMMQVIHTVQCLYAKLFKCDTATHNPDHVHEKMRYFHGDIDRMAKRCLIIYLIFCCCDNFRWHFHVPVRFLIYNNWLVQGVNKSPLIRRQQQINFPHDTFLMMLNIFAFLMSFCLERQKRGWEGLFPDCLWSRRCHGYHFKIVLFPVVPFYVCL